MKKKLLYTLFTGALVIVSAIFLISMTEIKTKVKHSLFGVTLSVVNHSSTSWTSIVVAGTTYTPSQLPCTCYPTTDDFIVTVNFSSGMTGAIQIVAADLNPLACSPSGGGNSRSLVHCLGSTTSAEIDIYAAQGCP